jgi:hypothetical protein
MIYQIKFKEIFSYDEKLVSDTINLDEFKIPEKYEGEVYEKGKITDKFVNNMIDQFYTQKLIPKKLIVILF